MLLKLCCVSVLEVSSGEYGSYKDILTEKINNGKNRDWRKTEHNCKLHLCLLLSDYCLKNVAVLRFGKYIYSFKYLISKRTK